MREDWVQIMDMSHGWGHEAHYFSHSNSVMGFSFLMVDKCILIHSRMTSTTSDGYSNYIDIIEMYRLRVWLILVWCLFYLQCFYNKFCKVIFLKKIITQPLLLTKLNLLLHTWSHSLIGYLCTWSHSQSHRLSLYLVTQSHWLSEGSFHKYNIISWTSKDFPFLRKPNLNMKWF